MLAALHPTPLWYLLVSAALFAIGAVGVLVRRNPLIMFMCVELMLNAVNLSFVTFATAYADVKGQTAVFFVLVVAAAVTGLLWSGFRLVVALTGRRKADAPRPADAT